MRENGDWLELELGSQGGSAGWVGVLERVFFGGEGGGGGLAERKEGPDRGRAWRQGRDELDER
jgi:hypothetical protein